MENHIPAQPNSYATCAVPSVDTLPTFPPMILPDTMAVPALPEQNEKSVTFFTRRPDSVPITMIASIAAMMQHRCTTVMVLPSHKINFYYTYTPIHFPAKYGFITNAGAELTIVHRSAKSERNDVSCEAPEDNLSVGLPEQPVQIRK